MTDQLRRPIPRLALTRDEAADALGISRNSFDRHVAPEVRVVRRGRLRLYPLPALEVWLARNEQDGPAQRLAS